MNKNRKNILTFVTGCNSSLFNNLKNILNYIVRIFIKKEIKTRIIIYNLGMTPNELNELDYDYGDAFYTFYKVMYPEKLHKYKNPKLNIERCLNKWDCKFVKYFENNIDTNTNKLNKIFIDNEGGLYDCNPIKIRGNSYVYGIIHKELFKAVLADSSGNKIESRYFTASMYDFSDDSIEREWDKANIGGDYSIISKIIIPETKIENFN